MTRPPSRQATAHLITATTEELRSSLSKTAWCLDLADGEVGSHINGQLVLGKGEYIEVFNPSTNELLHRYRDASLAQVHAAADSCARAQQSWAALRPIDRAATLRAVASEIAQEVDILAKVESITSGKTIADSVFQARKVAEMFDYYAGWADKLYGTVVPVPSGSLNYTLREPLGVILHIVPWNSPLYLAGWHVAPTIAVGNAVLLKPSELTPMTAILLARLAERAGLPQGVMNVLNGYGHTVANQAIAHPKVAKVGFVGSPGVGRKVAAAAAERPIPCLLELGGKSASLVFADADLDAACRSIASGIFGAAGQSCVASSRLLVEKTVQTQVLERLRAAADDLVVGDPLEPNTKIGPVNNKRQVRHISTMVENGVREGATCFTAKAGAEGPGNFVPPTILSDVTPNMEIAREEVFGPVLAVLPFETEEEAIRLANDTVYGLAGAVWTRDVTRAHRVAAQVNAGTFWVNTYKETDIASPFGGNNVSGYGRSSGVDALAEYTKVKSVWVSMK